MNTLFSKEELRFNKLISNTDGRPTSFLTDDKWQREFESRKIFIKPTPAKRMSGTKADGVIKNGVYYGTTNWQYYSSFINDVLHVIRSGLDDFCYYIYQIEELLRFEPNLCTRYEDGYWRVWLQKEKE